MSRIFISYRRNDAAFPAGALGRELRRRYGEAQIFRDRENMGAGESWRAQVLEEIDSESVLLVLIGPHWLAPAPGMAGLRSRLDDPDDPVRIELSDAIHDRAIIIPILLEGASMPERTALPSELQSVCDLHALPLRDGDWAHDVERLCGALERSGLQPIVAPDAGRSPWKHVSSLVLSGLALCALLDPLQPSERDGALIVTLVGLALGAVAAWEARRHRFARWWWSVAAVGLSVVTLLIASLREPNAPDDGAQPVLGTSEQSESPQTSAVP